MHIYCKKCNKHTANTFPKKLVLISKNKIKEKSRCAICLTQRSFIDEVQYDLKSALETYLQFFTGWSYNNNMNTYCLKCKTNTANIDPKMGKPKNNRLLMQSKGSVSGTKKSRFVKEKDAKGLLSHLGIKTPLSKIPLFNVLF